MQQLRLFVLALMLIALAVQGSCTGQETKSDRSMKTTSQIRAELLAQDYSEILQDSGFISLSCAKAASGADEYLRIYAENAAKRMGCNQPQRPLTAKECGMLIGWKLPNGENVLTQRNLMLGLGRYIREQGTIPQSGIEIYPNLLTNEGYASFCRLSPEQQVINYHCIINPITGKFFDSFNNPQWVYGGLSVEIIDGREEIARRFKAYAKTKVIVDMNTGQAVPCNRLVVITYYGENPDSVLCRWIEPQAV